MSSVFILAYFGIEKLPHLVLKVCQQGYETEPKGGAGKILMLTIFITLIFLFTAYTAYTVVLFQSTADDVKTLEDLYKSKMTLGSDDKSYFRKAFPVSNLLKYFINLQFKNGKQNIAIYIYIGAHIQISHSIISAR